MESGHIPVKRERHLDVIDEQFESKAHPLLLRRWRVAERGDKQDFRKDN